MFNRISVSICVKRVYLIPMIAISNYPLIAKTLSYNYWNESTISFPVDFIFQQFASLNFGSLCGIYRFVTAFIIFQEPTESIMMWPGYRTVWMRCAFLHAMTAQHDLIIMIYVSATHVSTRCGSYDHNLFMKRLDHMNVLYPHLTFFFVLLVYYSYSCSDRAFQKQAFGDVQMGFTL